ncbi:MAG: GNAT family N-acetyltransferase [Myxococcota bacterium]
MSTRLATPPWSLEPVRGDEAIEEVAALAFEIWNEHFPAIIGQAQVDYMLAELQSAGAIRRQIREAHYEYFLVGETEARAGYFALVAGSEEGSMQLSKLYVRREARGRGVGRRAIAWIVGECRGRGLSKIWLTVNKDNLESIAFYEHHGFVIQEAAAFDIGGGFMMDDYIMTRDT